MKSLLSADPKLKLLAKDLISKLSNSPDMVDEGFSYSGFKYIIKSRMGKTGYLVDMILIEPKKKSTRTKLTFRQKVRPKINSIVRSFAKLKNIPFTSNDRGVGYESGIHVRTDRYTRNIQVSIKPW